MEKTKAITAYTELELKVQGDRIIYTINACLARINMLAHLPHLLQNDAQIIRKYLKPNEVYFILKLLGDYGLLFDVSKINATENIGEYLQLGTVDKKIRKQQSIEYYRNSFQNAQVFLLVNILFYNNCIKGVVRKAKCAKFDKHLLGVMKYLQELKEIIISEVYVSGEEKKAKENELRRVFIVNKQLKDVVEVIKQQLAKQRRELGEQLENKLQILERYQNKMENIIRGSETEVKKTIITSEYQMMQVIEQSEVRQTYLVDLEDETVKKYQKLLTNNLTEEQKVRESRNKVADQLQTLINIFDQDIGDKQVEYEELLHQFNDVVNQKVTMERTLEEQNIIYEKSMIEKAEEEERIFNEMAYMCYLNRCAKKIQLYWKMYMTKRASTKKKKRKKK